MTTVDLLFRYTFTPSDATASALGNLHDVYGIRRIEIDPKASTLRIEYDATRLNAATVEHLVRNTGLKVEQLSQIPPQPAAA
jgi:hypothetical protein